MNVGPDWKSMEASFQQAVKDAASKAKTVAASRAIRASNELHNSALHILRGQRSGKVYRKPYSRSTYRASAPGEPPAVRSGTLRMSWSIRATGSSDGVVTPTIFTGQKYAPFLEDGTSKMAPRLFKQKIVDDAKPKVVQIFTEPFF